MTDTAASIRSLTGPFGPCLELCNAHGRAVVSLLGAQVLSWIPLGQSDVFWLTSSPAPAPAALRGGVPVCWPWFARQGVPTNSPQHGLVRTLPWRVLDSKVVGEEISVTLVPDWFHCQVTDKSLMERHLGVGIDALSLRQTITLNHNLAQELVTQNLSDKSVRLTQALHSYFSVGDAEQVRIQGLQGKVYLDKLKNFDRFVQNEEFSFHSACDRIYLQTGDQFVLSDPVLGRTITLVTSQSDTLVVWNPGEKEADRMVDVGARQWRNFFCLEASHAEPFGVTLNPKKACTLSQAISVKPIPPTYSG